jgi:hypothetical protein
VGRTRQASAATVLGPVTADWRSDSDYGPGGRLRSPRQDRRGLRSESYPPSLRKALMNAWPRGVPMPVMLS